MRIQWTRRLRLGFMSCILGGAPLVRSLSTFMSLKRRHWRIISFAILSVCMVIIFLSRGSVARAPSRVPVLITKLPPLPRSIAFRLYSQVADGISPIRVPYNPAGGPWMVLEDAMVGFAKTNGIQIVRFESAGSTEAYVCVRNKDASAMGRFVQALGRSANNAGAANRGQPVGADTNRTSGAAGPGG
jgi:hypothetical protein